MGSINSHIAHCRFCGRRFRTGSSNIIFSGQPPCSSPRLRFFCRVRLQKQRPLACVSNSIKFSVIFTLNIGSLTSLASGLTSTTAPPSLLPSSTTTTVITDFSVTRLLLVCHKPTNGDCPRASVLVRRRTEAIESLISENSTLYRHPSRLFRIN